MKKPKFKMPAKRTVWLVIIGTAGLAAAILYFSLPGITRNFLIGQAEQFGLKNLQFRVIRVGWRRLDIADVTVGDLGKPAVRIPYVSVQYTPAGLWQKKIRSIRMVGARIQFEDRGRGLEFRGLAAPPVAPEPSPAMVTVERLNLEDGELRLAWEGHSLEIPMTASLRAIGPDYSFTALLRPLAETVRLQGTFDKDFTAGKIGFVIPGFPLQTAIDQAGFGPAASGEGRIAARGEIILAKGNFRSAAIAVSGLDDLRLTIPDQGSVSLAAFSLDFNLDGVFAVRDIVAGITGRRMHFGEMTVVSPFTVDVRGRQLTDLEFSVRDLRIARPLPLTFERIAGKFTGPWSAARISGDFKIRSGAELLAALGLPGKIARPYVVDGEFHGGMAKGNIAWTLEARGKRHLAVDLGQTSLRGQFALNASLSGDAQRLHASTALRMPAADLRMAGYRARAGLFSAEAETDFVYGGNFQSRGLVSVSGGSIAASADDGLQASGIQLKLPWHWPGSGKSVEGGFSVARVQSNGLHGKDVSGILIQEGAALRFSGSVRSMIEKIMVTFQGRYSFSPAGGSLQADFAIPPVELAAGTELRPMHSLLGGMSGGGRFQAGGRLWLANGTAGGNAVLKIVNADIELPKEGIAVRGVNAEITLDRLFDLVSAPAQRLDFRELSWGDMVFSDGELVFAHESGGTFFIKSGRFVWCQGKIVIAPFRIKPAPSDFLMTFYCERIHFAQMLNTLTGKATVSSDAEMSGIIPVKMVKGNPVFLEGYLNSTPGKSGNLKVANPELISNGQLLVEEAIRDFRYDWIKVKMGGRDGLLDMVISMNGAPTLKLPLRYDAKKKDFIRDPKGGRHVELKGLLLDIRFLDIDVKDLLKASRQMTSSHQEK